MSSILYKLKREFFDWRTWNYFYKNMKNNTEKIAGTFKTDTLTPYLNKPGIAFSFDDSFRVNDWYKFGKELFGFYDVRVTFNINAHHHYEGQREHTQKEIDMLLELQSNGHEIAHHGYNHEDAVEYSKQMGINNWIKDEIDTLFDWMEGQSHSKTGEKFRRPVTFVFPRFNYNDETLKALVPKYFKIARGGFKGNYLTSINHTGFAPSICIDGHYLYNPRNINKVLKFAKKMGCHLILTCHSILPEEVQWEEFGWPMDDHEKRWRNSPKVIQGIINTAKNLDLEFYTTAEIAGIATFADRDFDRYVRELLSKQADDWILISEICSIKELDLSNQNISNLDGIQYFLSLEKLDICNNNIYDFRLLKKLTKLTDVNIGHQSSLSAYLL
jgi:sugar phosphate isomerase/epimerase